MKRIITAYSFYLLTALPASAAIHQDQPDYGHVVMTVETHFHKADADNSGFISKAEYVAISDVLKGQSEKEAHLDFNAMDMNGDGKLDFDEFYGELPSALTV